MTDGYGVIIVGAGFAGLGMGAALKRAGRDDFVILEKATEVGGTWRDNTYPGCACDIPSHLYSFSFAPNPDWSRVYSGSRRFSRTSKGFPKVWTYGGTWSSGRR